MDEESKRKRRFHSLALDPNYLTGMTTEKTQRVWEGIYKQSANTLKSISLDKESDNQEGEGASAVPAETIEETIEDLLDYSSNDEDFFFDSEDDYVNQQSDELTSERPTSSQKNVKSDNSASAKQYYLEDGDRVMFEKSQQTINDVIEMIVAYCLRFGDSREARSSLIEMFKICTGPEFKDLNISAYKLSQVFDPPPNKIRYHFYCSKCTKKVLLSCSKMEIKGQFILCEVCQAEHCIKLSNESCFLSVDMEYQLRTLLEKPEIAEFFFPENLLVSKNNNNTMCDVSDGILYKKTIETLHKTITYIISTDGAPLFHISKRGFWPLQIFLNNLPVNLRFKFILLCGVMIVRTESKPDLMNVLINVFLQQVNRLHSKGIELQLLNDDTKVILHLTPIFVVADSVARPILQNRLQYNGYYGCSYCYHRGLHVTDEGMKYPFLEKEPELRTHHSHLEDVAATKFHGSHIRGVKGESSFIEAPNIDMVWGFPLDYLHNALFGITVQVWTAWNTKFLKPAQRRAIDDLLLLVQPPRDLRRGVEKISNKGIWKATHWKSWLLYYCLPICSSFMPSDMLEHFALFVNSMFTLLQMEITNDELNTCEQNLMTFVANYEILYGVERMTFNIHAALHLVESVRQCGPPWATSAFPFEHNIGFLKETISGPKSVEQQMATKSLNLLRYRIRPLVRNISSEAKNFCERIFASKTFTKSAVTVQNVTFFGPNLKNIFQSVINKEFERCIYNNRVYSSIQYLRLKKFNDTVIRLKNGKFVQIQAIFLLPDNSCSFSVKELVVRPFFVGKTAISHIWEVIKNIEHVSISITEIHTKAVVLDFTNQQYVCEIPNTVEAE